MNTGPQDTRTPGSTLAGRRRVSLVAEVSLWTSAILCGAILLLAAHSAGVSARSAATFRSHNAQPQSFEVEGTTAQGASASLRSAHGDAVIGRLEIAAIGLKVPVLENYDPDSLKRGVGHIPGTASPGGLGNLGLAGHRDTFLRPVRNIRLGMEVDVITAEGRFRYMVDSTEIVTPDQVNVLDIHNRPELTLITCYPFQFIGAAPKRFIVHAHLLSLDAD